MTGLTGFIVHTNCGGCSGGYQDLNTLNAIVTTPHNHLNGEKTTTKKTSHIIKCFLCDILSSSCNAQYFNTTNITSKTYIRG